MDDLQDGVRAVVQDLTLNYYVRPNKVGDPDRAWLQLADDLNFLLQRYADVVDAAAQDWVELEQWQHSRDRWCQT